MTVRNVHDAYNLWQFNNLSKTAENNSRRMQETREVRENTTRPPKQPNQAAGLTPRSKYDVYEANSTANSERVIGGRTDLETEEAPKKFVYGMSSFLKEAFIEFDYDIPVREKQQVVSEENGVEGALERAQEQNNIANNGVAASDNAYKAVSLRKNESTESNREVADRIARNADARRGEKAAADRKSDARNEAQKRTEEAVARRGEGGKLTPAQEKGLEIYQRVQNQQNPFAISMAATANVA